MTCPPGEICTDAPYRDELLAIIQGGIDEHPRSAQVMPGPSEIGGCERKLAFKLAYGADGDGAGGWAAHKGTIMHAWLDSLFKRIDRVMPDGSPRFLSDMKLRQVSPHVNGGSLDLYDRLYKRVIDWKVPGDGTMKKARGSRIARGYTVQGDTYGLGLEMMGYEVFSVGLMFLPQCGDDLRSLANGAALKIWTYDRDNAIRALANVTRIKRMLAVASPQKVMSVLPTMSDFCQSCPAFVGSGDRRAICPGSSASDRVLDPSNPFSR